MSRLGDCTWWPKDWMTTHPTHGVLKNVRRVNNDLVLIVEREGVVGTGTIRAQLSEDFLILLRHMLLQQYGKLLSAVENVEINLDGLER